jgi:hypothetical protein
MATSPRKRWLLFGGSMVFVVISTWTLYDQGFDWSMVGGAFLFGTCALVALLQPQLEAFTELRTAEALCRITDQGFAFGRGYDFPFGAMKGRKLLPFGEVQEIRLNTFPSTALVNGNELIFLNGLKREAVEEAAIRQGLKTTGPLDIWELICEEFLDTEFEEDLKQRSLRRLEEAGIPPDEVLAIRKRLRHRMMAWTYLSLEWIYLGHYDVLGNSRPVSPKTYWWTMEIALRGGGV